MQTCNPLVVSCRASARRLPAALALAALSILAVGGPAGATGPRYVVTLLPELEEQEFSSPFGINEQGTVVGYAAPEPYHPLSLPLVAGGTSGVTSLPTVDNSFNFLHGINEAGQIAGESGRTACFWDAGKLRPLPVPDGFFSGAARDINNAGVLCGSYGDSDLLGPSHCVWIDPTRPPLTLHGLFVGNFAGAAWEINEKGQIAGVSGGSEGVFYAVRWDAPDAAPLQIGPLEGAFNSEGLGINEHGDVVGRSSFPDFSIQAIFFDGETGELVGLPFLDGGDGYAEARDVNDARQTVGVARAGEGIVHAVLWEDGEALDLNDLVFFLPPPIRYLQSAWAINDAGVIAVEAVLEGEQPDFPRRVALLTPVRSFRRGDCSGDGEVQGVTDAVYLLNFTFLGAAAPPCRAACDVNGDGDIGGVTDAVVILNFFFLGGSPPAAPYPACGPSPLPSDARLGCGTPPACP